MRPLIGLTTYRRILTTTIGERLHLALYGNYCEAVLEAGGAPVMLPATETFSVPELLQPLEGLLLVGGADIAPELYGQPAHFTVDRVDTVRDRFELEIVRYALRRRLPILGVCRGMQLLNVALGGSLIQDIASVTGSGLRHSRPDAIDDPVHSVWVQPGSRLAQYVGTTVLAVNSGHHQAVGRVAQGLRVVAIAEDGTTEALEGDQPAWMLGVQWHPEMMFARYREQLEIFRALVEARAITREEQRDAIA